MHFQKIFFLFTYHHAITLFIIKLPCLHFYFTFNMFTKFNFIGNLKRNCFCQKNRYIIYCHLINFKYYHFFNPIISLRKG